MTPSKYTAPCSAPGCTATIAEVVPVGEATGPTLAAVKRFWLEHLQYAHPDLRPDATVDDAPVQAEYT